MGIFFLVDSWNGPKLAALPLDEFRANLLLLVKNFGSDDLDWS